MKFKHVKAFFVTVMGILMLQSVDVTASQEIHTSAVQAEVNETQDTPGEKTREEQQADKEERTKKKDKSTKNKKNKKNKKKGNKNKKKKQQKQEVSELVITPVTNYLNIRNAPNLEGEVIGKLYRHSVGTLLEEAEDGWYKISSGSVTGYVKSEYVLRGEEGIALAEEVGQRFARIETTTLRIRKEPSTDASTVGLLPDGDILEVQEEIDGWAKIGTGDMEGYISVDYAEIYTENAVAESKEEEEARLRKEAEERRLAEEAAAQEAERRRAEDAHQNMASSPSGNGTANNKNLGRRIADYALQFVGNPYVYGGTSLTNGADCSGFVMSVYKNFGISLPRTSGEQRYSGWEVGSLSNAREGDLVCYPGHIGIYIGNGKIVHASTAATGIKVSNANYRSISAIRRIV